jgi:hypothetical protein
MTNAQYAICTLGCALIAVVALRFDDNAACITATSVSIINAALWFESFRRGKGRS